MAEHIIDIDHITKRFADNTIINDLSLSVEQGEVLVLVGPSGCGKSTLLRCINGLEPIQGGSIKLHGEPVDRNGIPELRSFPSYDRDEEYNACSAQGAEPKQGRSDRKSYGAAEARWP